MSNITISDIAKKAGVSAGTVDRVLHNRGRVSVENQQKIEKAIEELGYKPNMTARALVSRKNLNICAVIPSNSDGDYWASVEKGLYKAVSDTEYSNLNLDVVYYDQYSSLSFAEAVDSVKSKDDVNGVILATHFEAMVREFTAYLDEKEIAYVFVDSNIDGCNELAYFGLDAYDSGYATAELALNITQAEGQVVLVDFKLTEGEASTQSIIRSNGFVDCFVKNGAKDRLVFFDLNTNLQDYESRLDKLFESNLAIQTVVTLNSRSYYVADYLKKNNKKGIKMIGFDLIQKNVDFLEKRVVSFLISQHPEKQGYSAVEALFEHTILKADIKNVNYMPIDIITTANLKYYQDI